MDRLDSRDQPSQVAAPYNVEWLRKLVIRGPNYPGAYEARKNPKKGPLVWLGTPKKDMEGLLFWYVLLVVLVRKLSDFSDFSGKSVDQ